MRNRLDNIQHATTMLKKKFRPRLIKTALTVAVFGLLVFLNPYNFFNPFREILFKAVYPIEKTFCFLSWKVSQTSDVISSIGELKQENGRLHEENLKLLSENAMLHDMESENEMLRKELKMLPRGKFELEPARIISYDSRGQGNWIKIDKGRKHGVRIGMPIIISDSVMVGKVEKVFSESSQVILITSSQSSINSVVGATGAKGIIKGRYGLKMIMDMVLQTDLINIGDEVITSGVSSNIPRGLLLGTINEISLSPDHLFRQAVVSPASDFSRLNIVFIIKSVKREI